MSRREAGMNEETLSGLDVSAIDNKDLAVLHDAFVIRSLDISIHLSVHAVDPAQLDGSATAPAIRTIDLHIRPRRSPGQALLAVLGKTQMHKLRIPGMTLRIRRTLELVNLLPVLRRRLFSDEISQKAAESLFSQIYEKYADEASALEVVALFRNVPPECAGSIALTANLQQASFLPDSRLKPPYKYSYGYYLSVLRDASGKLRRLLLRLE